MNESLIADQMIEENFTKSNLVALVYPKNDDYSIEKKMLEELEAANEIDSTKGLSNIEAQDGYMLEDKLTPASSPRWPTLTTRPPSSSTPPTPSRTRSTARSSATSLL